MSLPNSIGTEAVRGFILQASYRVVAEASGRRIPVVYLYGRLEDGATFLVRDGRQRTHFYIPAEAAERARRLGAPEPQPKGILDAEELERRKVR